MIWTKETVRAKLESNRYFDLLASEEKGIFSLSYNIGGNTVVLFNTVGGYAEVFLYPPFYKEFINEACDFAIIAKDILNESIQKQNRL